MLSLGALTITANNICSTAVTHLVEGPDNVVAQNGAQRRRDLQEGRRHEHAARPQHAADFRELHRHRA